MNHSITESQEDILTRMNHYPKTTLEKVNPYMNCLIHQVMDILNHIQQKEYKNDQIIIQSLHPFIPSTSTILYLQLNESYFHQLNIDSQTDEGMDHSSIKISQAMKLNHHVQWTLLSKRTVHFSLPQYVLGTRIKLEMNMDQVPHWGYKYYLFIKRFCGKTEAKKQDIIWFIFLVRLLLQYTFLLIDSSIVDPLCATLITWICIEHSRRIYPLVTPAMPYRLHFIQLLSCLLYQVNKKGQQPISHSTAEQLNQLLYYLIYEIKNILRQVYSEFLF